MFFFFFQAEDGIRDIGVTGVQTCALPILGDNALRVGGGVDVAAVGEMDDAAVGVAESHQLAGRSPRSTELPSKVARRSASTSSSCCLPLCPKNSTGFCQTTLSISSSP